MNAKQHRAGRFTLGRRSRNSRRLAKPDLRTALRKYSDASSTNRSPISLPDEVWVWDSAISSHQLQ